MSAKISCVGAALVGVLLGSCLPSQPDEAQTDPANTSGVAASTAPLDIAITRFPGAYVGRWGQNANDCQPGRSDAKGLMSVQGSLVKFYESVGTMRKGTRESTVSVKGDFEFMGEGQKWEKPMQFKLDKDRKQLVRTDMADGSKTIYTRCPD